MISPALRIYGLRQGLTRGDFSESLQVLIKSIGMLSNSGLNGGSNDAVLDYVLYYCSSSIFWVLTMWQIWW